MLVWSQSMVEDDVELGLLDRGASQQGGVSRCGLDG
jgi:hypothetical protein